MALLVSLSLRFKCLLAPVTPTGSLENRSCFHRTVTSFPQNVRKAKYILLSSLGYAWQFLHKPTYHINSYEQRFYKPVLLWDTGAGTKFSCCSEMFFLGRGVESAKNKSYASIISARCFHKYYQSMLMQGDKFQSHIKTTRSNIVV
jgi:hypothetical protein